MPDVHVVHPLARKARRHLLPFLLELEDDRQKLLDVRRRHVVAVRPLDERLALEIEDGDERGHRDTSVLETRALEIQTGYSLSNRTTENWKR